MKKDSHENKSAIDTIHKVMNSCYKITELVSLSHERKLTSNEKFKLYSHLMICNGCRNYFKNSKKLNEMIKQHKVYEAKQTKISDDET